MIKNICISIGFMFVWVTAGVLLGHFDAGRPLTMTIGFLLVI